MNNEEKKQDEAITKKLVEYLRGTLRRVMTEIEAMEGLTSGEKGSLMQQIGIKLVELGNNKILIENLMNERLEKMETPEKGRMN
jgi:hypothetical protein